MRQSGTKSESSLMKSQIHLLSLVEGFFQSHVLFALLRLNIFELLGEGQKTAEELAAAVDARPETLKRLLNAGVMLKLLECKDGSRYEITPAYREHLLPSGGQAYLGDWIRLQDEFCAGLSKLDQAVLTSSPTIEPSTYLGKDRERTRRYIKAMHNYAGLRGKELAHYLDISGCKSMLDLGCGGGTYAYLLGMKNPGMRLYLADFPEVLEVAREIRQDYPIENKVEYMPLDAASDPIPGSYDLILVSNMLHCFDEAQRNRLLRQLYQATNPGGSLVVQAQYLQENRMGGRWAIFVDLNLLITTAKGRNHTPAETKAWLEETGFRDIEYNPMSIFGANAYVRGYKKR